MITTDKKNDLFSVLKKDTEIEKGKKEENHKQIDLNLYFQNSLAILQNGNEEAGVHALASLTNILKLNKNIQFPTDFLLFLVNKIGVDTVHPGFRKFTLLFLKTLVQINPQIIETIFNSQDEFLKFVQLLRQMLPDSSSTKLLKTMIKLDRNLCACLASSGFHKELLYFMENIDKQIFYPDPNSKLNKFSYFEKNYVSILTSLQSCVQFDSEDRYKFLYLFNRSFSSTRPATGHAQHNYIKFLIELVNNSIDQSKLFMEDFVNSNLIPKLLESFSKPTYSRERKNVLKYFILICQTSPSYINRFLDSRVSQLIFSKIINFDRENEDESLQKNDPRKEIVEFATCICKVSYELCLQILNEDLFHDMAFEFNQCKLSFQRTLFIFFITILEKYGNFPYIQNLFLTIQETFFDFCDLMIETDSELQLMTINLITDLITKAPEETGFISSLKEHVQSDVFRENLLSKVEREFQDEASAQYIEKLINAIDEI